MNITTLKRVLKAEVKVRDRTFLGLGLTNEQYHQAIFKEYQKLEKQEKLRRRNGHSQD